MNNDHNKTATEKPRTAVNMRLPTDLLDALRVEAEAQERSVTSIVIEALTNHLKKVDDDQR